jgi:hypothetical protein
MLIGAKQDIPVSFVIKILWSGVAVSIPELLRKPASDQSDYRTYAVDMQTGRLIEMNGPIRLRQHVRYDLFHEIFARCAKIS